MSLLELRTAMLADVRVDSQIITHIESNNAYANSMLNEARNYSVSGLNQYTRP